MGVSKAEGQKLTRGTALSVHHYEGIFLEENIGSQNWSLASAPFSCQPSSSLRNPSLVCTPWLFNCTLCESVLSTQEFNFTRRGSNSRATSPVFLASGWSSEILASLWASPAESSETLSINLILEARAAPKLRKRLRQTWQTHQSCKQTGEPGLVDFKNWYVLQAWCPYW